MALILAENDQNCPILVHLQYKLIIRTKHEVSLSVAIGIIASLLM